MERGRAGRMRGEGRDWERVDLGQLEQLKEGTGRVHLGQLEQLKEGTGRVHLGQLEQWKSLQFLRSCCKFSHSFSRMQKPLQGMRCPRGEG